MISSLLRINNIVGRSINNQIVWKFATGEKLLKATKALTKISSTELDKLC